MNTYWTIKLVTENANATCPAWLVWSLVGLGVAFAVTAVVIMIKMWK